MLESIVDPTITIEPATKLINFILNHVRCTDDAPIGIVSLRESNRSDRDEIATASLKIEDLQWLNRYLIEYRRTTERKIYLHQLVHSSDVVLPSPRTTPRNPELEARIQRLTARLDAKEYRAMTKNIDSVRKFLPEDTVAYQMKQINKQLIAVAQFVFSVVAAFVFGFIGVELLVEDLDFGFRLLLGIICALIVALAEIYFLALKLNDNGYDVSTTFAPEKLHRE